MADEKKEEVDESRRDFLKKSGYAAGGLVVGGGVVGSLLGINFGSEETGTTSKKEEPQYNKALMYFKNQKEFETLAEATEQIYPADDNGPGAIELGVPYFIDHQLAGAYGNNSREYMQGPFKTGSDYQGYQSRLKRHEIFIQGIRELEKQSQKQYDDSFKDISDEDKGELLSKFENDDVNMKAVKASEFFNLLVSATMSGVYSDPLYGGNIKMEGWKMKEYPGNQMSYTDEIEKEEFVEMEPKALNDHINI